MPSSGRLHLALLAVVIGCGRMRSTAERNDSTFVRTMVELRRIAADSSLDSAGRAAARARVLQGKGLTAEAFARRARTLADDPVRASALWDAVEQQVHRPPAQTVPTGSRGNTTSIAPTASGIRPPAPASGTHQ